MRLHTVLALIIMLLLAAACGPASAVEPLPTEDPTEAAAPDQQEPSEGDENGGQTDSESEMISGEPIIDSGEATILESFPVQVTVIVTGSLQDGCTTIDTVEVEPLEDMTFDVNITTVRPADAVCTEALVPFEETISLPVEGLEAGEYTVEVNDTTETFTLETDNIMTDEDARPQPEPAGESDAQIDRVTVQDDGLVRIEATSPDGCTDFYEVVEQRSGTTITLSVTRDVPSGVMCTMAFTPFSLDYQLEDLEAGTQYTVIVGSFEDTVTISE
ncbi:MAG: hypothetical protein ACFB51_21560 [Anaerolineae bacterium]